MFFVKHGRKIHVRKTKIAPSTFTKMSNNEQVSLDILAKICLELECGFDDKSSKRVMLITAFPVFFISAKRDYDKAHQNYMKNLPEK